MATVKNKLTPFEREAQMLSLLEKAFSDQLSWGELLMQLRKNVLGLSQERYAGLTGISRRTLSDIEQNKESVTLLSINQAFRPLGLKIGAVPRQPEMMAALLTHMANNEHPHDNP
jgi:Helix-turn-helix.